MGIIDTAKGLADLTVKIHDNQLKIEFQTKIIDLQTQVLEVQNEITALRQKIHAHENADAIRKMLRHERNAYWKTDENPQRPYCTACFDGKCKLMSLAVARSEVDAYCPSCRAEFYQVFGDYQHEPVQEVRTIATFANDMLYP